MKEESKNRELQRLLRRETGSIIVFTRSKDGATRVWRSLHSAGFYDATYIHSDRLQAHREQALAEFKEGKYRILIATDVAARGIPHRGRRARRELRPADGSRRLRPSHRPHGPRGRDGQVDDLLHAARSRHHP